MKTRTIIMLSLIATFVLCQAVVWSQENTLSSSKARRVAPAPQNRPPQNRPRPQRPGQERRRGGGPLMALLDVNKDRNLSVAELQNVVEKLRTFDTNKDGKWSVEELEQAHQKLRGGRDDRGAGQRAGQRRGERRGQRPSNQRVTRPSTNRQER
jgi:hypothetical protein